MCRTHECRDGHDVRERRGANNAARCRSGSLFAPKGAPTTRHANSSQNEGRKFRGSGYRRSLTAKSRCRPVAGVCTTPCLRK